MARKHSRLASAAVLLLAGAACAESPVGPAAGPAAGPTPPTPPPATRPVLAPLIVSEARAGVVDHMDPGSPAVAYIALPPGSLGTVDTVRIRNLAGSDPAVALPLVYGAFMDPLGRIFVGHPDGSVREVQRSAPCADGSPWWLQLSPDGSRILFMPEWMGPSDVCVMNVDGSNMVSLGIWASVAWTENGEAVMYVERDTIKTLRLDGSRQQVPVLMTADCCGPYELYSDLDVAPDRRIVFGSGLMLAPDGSFLRRLPALYSPKWSPDGSRIAYVAPDGGSGSGYVVGSMAPDGSDHRIHVSRPAGIGPGSPAWSPDGRQIAFVDMSAAAIYAFEIETGAIVELHRGPAIQVTWATAGP